MASEVIEKVIYNGSFTIRHNPFAKGSQSRYVVTDNETGVISRPKGITTILGATLAKDFVGWALDCMEEAILRKQYSAVISDEYLTPEDILDAKKEAERRRIDASSTGNLTHALIERYLKTKTAEMPQKNISAINAFGAFYRWMVETNPKVLATEEVVYSREGNYAGTFDALMEINGKTYLVDFKTTNTSKKAPKGVYPENFIQLGAYAMAYLEEHPGAPLDGLMVVSIRKDGQLDVVVKDDVDDCIALVWPVLELYRFLGETL